MTAKKPTRASRSARSKALTTAGQPKGPRYWICVIGPVPADKLPWGADGPPRAAAQKAVSDMAGRWPDNCWSGWASPAQAEAVRAAWGTSC